jgi:hypothetical protein
MAKSATSFQKGQSGNPKGRPPAIPEEIKALCREHTLESIETIVAIMRNKKESGAVRGAMANSLIDRGWGKATQPVSGEDGAPITVQIVKYAGDPASQ